MSNLANITINIDGDVFMAIKELKVQFDRLSNSVSSMEGEVEGAFQHMVDGASRAQNSVKIIAFDAINRISVTLGAPFRAGV